MLEIEVVKELFVVTDNKTSERNLFIDQGVYTRNRNFRILLSTKLSKRAPLSHTSNPTKNYTQKDLTLFLQTLVCAVSVGPQTRILSLDRTDGGVGRKSGGVGGIRRERGVEGMVIESPFPEIDGFLRRWIRENVPGGERARLQMVAYFRDTSKTATYSVTGNRYCFRIQREHKSNGVYYVAELSRGTFTQRCHDPDCRYYRSPEVEIPIELNPFVAEDHQTAVDVGDLIEKDVVGDDGKELRGDGLV
ncbi:hypothetical protein HDU67_002458 [Dinochytrium kinnereticum]|nr:hypothetical protein HDU67_002458 [Dinochytrium kinnereticum]